MTMLAGASPQAHYAIIWMEGSGSQEPSVEWRWNIPKLQKRQSNLPSKGSPQIVESMLAGKQASRTLAEETYRRLRGDIIWGILEPNAPLPSTELCATYRVGISPLREALSRLAAEHLVTSIEHRGFRVAPISADDVIGTMEARVLIESDALRRSIKYGDVAWESRIVAALHSLQRAPLPTGPGEVAEAWAEAHREYHAALIGACKSEWLTKLATLLFPQAERHRIYQARVDGPAASYATVPMNTACSPRRRSIETPRKPSGRWKSTIDTPLSRLFGRWRTKRGRGLKSRGLNDILENFINNSKHKELSSMAATGPRS